MNIEQKRAFHRVFKRLRPADMKTVENAISAIVDNPEIGEEKRGDLSKLCVYKFRMNKQLMLLAYRYEPLEDTLYLEALGPHENFYRDLKRN